MIPLASTSADMDKHPLITWEQWAAANAALGIKVQPKSAWR